MPTSRSAKKRLRQDIVRRARNRSLKSAVKTQIKKVHAALAEGDLERARSEFRVAQQRLDRAAARNMIHPNAAARLKSRLNARIQTTENSDAKPKRWSLRRRSRSKQAS
jgi:small subunit ribosomal protein S20